MTATERHFLLDLAHFTFGRTLRVILVAGLIVGAALTYNAVYGPAYTASMRVLVTPSASNLPITGTGISGPGVSGLGAPGTEPGTSAAATLVVQDHGQTARNQAELLGDPGLIRKLLPELKAPIAGAKPTRTAGPVGYLHNLLDRNWRIYAENLGLISPASDAERFASRLSHALKVQAIGDTDVIKLEFTWGDRMFAATALNGIVEGYQRAVAMTADARATLQRAQATLDSSQAELAAVNAQLTEAKAALHAAAADTDTAQIETRLAQAQSSADAMRVDRELIRRKLAAAEQSYKTGGWVDAGDAGADAGQSKLAQNFADLLRKRQALANDGAGDKDGRGDNAGTAGIDRQIRQVREQNYRHVRALLTGQLSALDDKLTEIKAGIAHDGDALRTIDAQNARIPVLTDGRAAKLLAVSDARRQLDAARQAIDSAWQEVGGTRALSQAFPPAEPDWPAPPLLLKLSLAVGLVAGLGSAVAAERSRRTIDRPLDISRHLGIDVLARLDDVPARQLR